MGTDTAPAPETGTAAPDTPDGPSGPRAGFGHRLGAYILDVLVLTIPIVILIAVLPNDAAVVANLLSIVIGIAYFTMLEGGPKGQTLGKMALGIRVYDLKNGGPIGYGRAFIRYIGRLVSGMVILLGYLWMLWDREKQTWHDKFAGSVVVPTDAYPVS